MEEQKNNIKHKKPHKFDMPMYDEPLDMYLAHEEYLADSFEPKAKHSIPVVSGFNDFLFAGDSSKKDNSYPGCPTYIPQVLPEEEAPPIVDRDFLTNPGYYPNPETVGRKPFLPEEVDNLIIVENDTKRYGLSMALDQDIRTTKPYYIYNTYGAIRRLWNDPTRISEDIAGTGNSSKWIKLYSVDISGEGPTNKTQTPFFPIYQLAHRRYKPTVEKTIKNMIALATKAKGKIFIATDPTEDGEMLAWHIWYILHQYEVEKNLGDTLTRKISRLNLFAYTKENIEKAIDNADTINEVKRAVGAVESVFNRLFTFSTKYVFDDLVGISRSIRMSKQDKRKRPIYLNPGEAIVLDNLANNALQITPPQYKYEVTVAFEHSTKSKNFQASKEVTEKELQIIKNLNDRDSKIRVEPPTKHKIETPKPPNALDIAKAVQELLGKPFTYKIYQILKDLYYYGFISSPDTYENTYTKKTFNYLSNLFADTKLKHIYKSKNSQNAIYPLVADIKNEIRKFPELVRQNIFRDTDKYKLMIMVFELIKALSLSSLSNPIKYNKYKIKIKKTSFDIPVITNLGFLVLWDNTILQSKYLENHGLYANNKKPQATKYKLTVLSHLDQTNGVNPLTSFQLSSVPVSVAFKSAETTKGGLVGNTLALSYGGANIYLTALGGFVASILKEVLGEDYVKTDILNAYTNVEDLNSPDFAKAVKRRQTYIVKILSSLWNGMPEKVAKGIDVIQKIVANYKRRGARNHWLDTPNFINMYPYSAIKIEKDIIETYKFFDKHNKLTETGDFISIPLANEKDSVIVWKCGADLFTKVLVQYKLNNRNVIWATTYRHGSNYDSIQDAMQTANSLSRMIPEKYLLENIWTDFLNLNWDSKSIVPEASFPIIVA